MNVLKSLFSSVGLTKRLAFNDFKAKFSGSYFGILWAFIQPIVTIMIYVFIFQVGFKAAPVTISGNITYPYVLWLIAGIIPWFFFSEALMNSTTCLVEYSYLVKKVVFKIEVLPVVKILSSLFVHLFFILFAVIIHMVNGWMPPLHFLQIVYYMIACIILVFALSYLTSSIVPFFRDFTQIVNIFLQVGMWLCPIMWNESAMASHPWVLTILKLNPMYYIVSGYRSCFMGDAWFWDRPFLTAYFWIFVVVLFFVGQAVYNRLKVHFSDVL